MFNLALNNKILMGSTQENESTRKQPFESSMENISQLSEIFFPNLFDTRTYPLNFPFVIIA
jgi:hypothetical protein